MVGGGGCCRRGLLRWGGVVGAGGCCKLGGLLKWNMVIG